MVGGAWPGGGGSTGTAPLIGGRTDTPPSGLGNEKKNQQLIPLLKWKRNKKILYGDLHEQKKLLQLWIAKNNFFAQKLL